MLEFVCHLVLVPIFHIKSLITVNRGSRMTGPEDPAKRENLEFERGSE
jgi:hypothetical protein